MIKKLICWLWGHGALIKCGDFRRVANITTKTTYIRCKRCLKRFDSESDKPQPEQDMYDVLYNIPQP